VDKIKWCLEVKNGIELVEPNANLAKAYVKKAEESLEVMRSMENRDWKISTAYYTMYFSLYAVLMRFGIKCEIHSCSIEFMKRFLSDFNEEECRLLEDSLKARVDTQYYVSRKVPDRVCEMMVREAPGFLVKCKSVLLKIDERKIKEIRKQVREIVE